MTFTEVPFLDSSSALYYIRTLSPIHIGTGEIISSAEILVTKEDTPTDPTLPIATKIYRADLQSIIENLMPEPQKLSAFHSSLRMAIRENIQSVMLKELIKKYPLYEIYASSKKLEINREYHEQIKTDNRAFIPGSTIKGAIFSAIMSHALMQLSDASPKYKRFIIETLTKNTSHSNEEDKLYDALATITFAWLKYGEEMIKRFPKPEALRRKRYFRFWRWLAVSDTGLISIPQALQANVLIRIKGGENGLRKTNLEFVAECLKKGISFLFLLQSQQDSRLTIKQILNITHQHYSRLLEREKLWFEERSLMHNLITPSKNSTLVRIGHGSGLDSTSLLMVAEHLGEHVLKTYVEKWELTEHKTPYSTTKWVTLITDKYGHEQYFPLGWAEISPPPEVNQNDYPKG